MKKSAIVIVSFLVIASYVHAQSFLPVYERGHGKLVLDLEIGGDTDDEDYMFNMAYRVCVDQDGNMIVADFRDKILKIFNRDGKYIKTFSGEGSGPGEHSWISGMTLTSDNQLVTFDQINRRFNIYDTGGEFVRSVLSSEVIHSPFEMVMEMESTRDGRIILYSRKMNFQNLQSGTLHRILQTSNDFTEMTVIDSIRIIDMKMVTEPTPMPIPFPYAPKLLWRVMPSGNIIYGSSEEYIFKILSPDLSFIDQLQHESPRKKVTKKAINRYWARIDSSLTSRGFPEDRLKIIKKNAEFPEYFPYCDDVQIDHEGYILVLPHEEKQEYIYDVFKPTGEFVNRVDLERFPTHPVFLDGFIYGIKYTEDEYSSVVRYRL